MDRRDLFRSPRTSPGIPDLIRGDRVDSLKSGTLSPEILVVSADTPTILKNSENFLLMAETIFKSGDGITFTGRVPALTQPFRYTGSHIANLRPDENDSHAIPERGGLSGGHYRFPVSSHSRNLSLFSRIFTGSKGCLGTPGMNIQPRNGIPGSDSGRPIR